MTICSDCGHEVFAIDTESDEWCDVLDSIKKYVDLSKEDLARMLYDESGEGLTKRQLREMTKGELVSDLIVSIYGG